MFRKKDDEMLVTEPEPRREETAYEDNWYRSLKAMREQQEREEPEVEEAADAPVEANADAEAAGDAAPDDALPEELQVRAGQLLERLRTLQHLADEVPPEQDPEPEQGSVWG
jgi:hypothetical protein